MRQNNNHVVEVQFLLHVQYDAYSPGTKGRDNVRCIGGAFK